MNHYINIDIKSNANIPENVLMNKIYSKFHEALFSLKSTDIGVSFPRCKITLGRTLRIHGTKEKLISLQNLKWLGELSDYCETSNIDIIPDNVTHRTISRKQSNLTSSKLNRLIKRQKISIEEIKQYKAKMFERGLDNPYLEIESGSNGNIYRRYFALSECIDRACEGKFDYFGLSKNATIPWF